MEDRSVHTIQTHTPIWIRPDLTPPAAIDTVIFDVDGVLWDTRASFDVTVQRTVDFMLRTVYGVADPQPVTEAELRAYRRAGGLNNDWHMSYVLIAARLAGYTDPFQAAAETQGRGMAWADKILPPGVRIDFDLLVWIYNEIYWGQEDFQRVFGAPARFVNEPQGCWRNERPLLGPDTLDRLRARGVAHFGLATGRTRDELRTVLDASNLEAHIPQEAMVTGDVLAKPDGRVLQRVLAGLDRAGRNNGHGKPTAALFCGDTLDDLLAVQNYRALAGAKGRWIGAVAVVPPEEQDYFKQAGADAVIEHVKQVEDVLETIRGL